MNNYTKRCDWANNSRIEQQYHDFVWGIPEHDDQKLFKALILEVMQAGLSWQIVLNKLDAFEQAFDNFNPKVIAMYDDDKESELLQNRLIIRNQLKIQSLKYNAQAFLNITEEYGSFNRFIWAYVNDRPIINNWYLSEEIPSKTDLSEQISRDLKQRGFKFVGPISVYAFMQATGMVNDHLINCTFR